MRKILAICIFIILGFSNINAKTFIINDSLKVEGEIIYSSSSCSIIKDNSKNPVYWILSEIANALLPEASRYICLQVVGQDNHEICDAIANSIDFFTSVVGTGKKTVKIVKELVEYTAEKGTQKSGLYFTTQMLDLAYNIKNTIEAYDKLNLVNWDNVSIADEIIQNNTYIGNVVIENVTNQSFNIQCSHDGIEWTTITIGAGKYKTISFWTGYYKQNYGFCKGSSLCNYQVYTDKTYKIRYSKSNNSFYIEEK